MGTALVPNLMVAGAWQGRKSSNRGTTDEEVVTRGSQRALMMMEEE